MSTRLVTVPIVIGYLGLDGYGIWSIIMATAGFMRFGSAGVKSAFQKYVAEATGLGDFGKANKLLSTGTASMLVLSVVGLIPIAAFSQSLARFMGVPDEFLDSTAMAITLLAVIMVLSNVGAVFEAIVMGGHRIDLARKLGTVFTILEAIVIVVFLYEGYGLVAMTAVMALSEIGFLLCCYFVSRSILPAIQIAIKHLSRSVLSELFSFAGSYQLISIVEILSAVILPVAILKLFGSDVAGIYAVTSRVIMAALLPQEAFLLPILSSGSVVYAAGSIEKLRLFFENAFKTTAILTMLPLGFIASHGTLIILAWTGLADPAIQNVLWMMCVSSLCRSLSRLAFVLYRASGRMWMDNLRQVLLISVVVVTVNFGDDLGFIGVLGCLTVAEFIAMIFMLAALSNVFSEFSAKMLVSNLAKLMIATLAMMVISAIVASVLAPWAESERLLTALKLGGIVLVSIVSVLPALFLTNTLSRSEASVIFNILRGKAHRIA